MDTRVLLPIPWHKFDSYEPGLLLLAITRVRVASLLVTIDRMEVANCLRGRQSRDHKSV
jgi:hypothetical protein